MPRSTPLGISASLAAEAIHRLALAFELEGQEVRALSGVRVHAWPVLSWRGLVKPHRRQR